MRRKRRETSSAFKGILLVMLSTMSEVLAPAAIFGFLGFAFLVPIELIIPGGQLEWLVRTARQNWGLLALLAWFLLLTAFWQASESHSQRQQLDALRRRLQRLQPDD